MNRTRTVAAVSSAALTMLLVSGCHVSSNKHGGDNVKISTPFGGVQVKTDNAAVLSEIGLPEYPGATLVKKNGDDKGSADVNLNFGSFHLRVNAAGYRTADSPDMVKAFYRKALAKYGDVIECRDYKTVGTPVKTAEGLTCDDHSDARVHISDDLTGKTQLKAGSKQHQHIVEIDADGTGTKFGLVALELPGRLASERNNQSTQ